MATLKQDTGECLALGDLPASWHAPRISIEGGTRSQSWVSRAEVIHLCGAEADQNKEPAATIKLTP